MKISLVVPVFNEQEAVPIFYKAVRGSEELKNLSVEILFVDDGSSDKTLSEVKALAASDEQVSYISFTRNFGKEPALFAGIHKAAGDAVIPIDVDLQDPIEVIPQLIAKWQEGYDVVLAKRADRSSDGVLKRFSAGMFYKLHNKISHPIIEDNVGDFRLISRQTVDRIKKLKERNLFMKGVLSWPGGKTAVVEYVRSERSAGHTKFNGWKLWNLAIEGITSFSTVPLRVWSYIGFSVASLAFAYGAWMIADKLIWGNQVQGYPSLMVSILFLGGIQLIGIGVLGEYIGRIYTETKARPTYLIEEESAS
ncbi:glycosyltransferase family 2 protein [Pseudomonas sp. BRM28]|uniref:glycosyltransferase family 2 protein n=1 Tax=Pseudomonas sp. BRM28 TaxID=2045201 RepID=UPI000CEE05BA|nr:glycosyltransferase family 2 protein [Pseudomonas sp. BRM28]PPS62776.1 glycosyltransferase [Pseudomonas sp. BRM28]